MTDKNMATVERTTEPNQQLVEAVARAVRLARFERNGRGKAYDPDLPLHETEIADAIAAIQATDGECQRLRSALEVIQAEPIDLSTLPPPRELEEAMRKIAEIADARIDTVHFTGTKIRKQHNDLCGALSGILFVAEAALEALTTRSQPGEDVVERAARALAPILAGAQEDERGNDLPDRQFDDLPPDWQERHREYARAALNAAALPVEGVREQHDERCPLHWLPKGRALAKCWCNALLTPSEDK